MGLGVDAKWGVTKVVVTDEQKVRVASLMLEGLERYEVMEEIFPDAVQFYDNPDFPGRIAPMEGLVPYDYVGETGIYNRSYSGWSMFRCWLQGELGMDDTKEWWHSATEDMPCYHLLAFSDCEGFIGTTACLRILADLERFPDLVKRADECTDDHGEDGWKLETLSALLVGLRQIREHGSGGLDFH